MNDKQKLLAIFEKIIPYRPSAQWILVMLKTWNIDQNMSKKLFEIISWYIETVQDENLKNTMIKLQSYIQKIHNEEVKERENVSAELEDILASLDEIN